MGFEPTPFRTGALIQRLRPLGHLIPPPRPPRLLNSTLICEFVFGFFFWQFICNSLSLFGHMVCKTHTRVCVMAMDINAIDRYQIDIMIIHGNS